MKLICIVKFVPDVDNFKYDYENNTLIRENVRLTLNPDDSCAVAFALKVKEFHKDTTVSVVTMAPKSIMPHMEDLIRIGADNGIILSDRAFAGSDTYATSKVLAKYLSGQEYDYILTGTQALDGDTSHVPAQVAERLGINQMSGIVRVDLESFSNRSAIIAVDNEKASITYEADMPAVLSLTRTSGYKLPYPKRADIIKDVKDSITVLGMKDIGLSEEETGIKGSLTKVIGTYTKKFEKKEKKRVLVDEEGIETVFGFLKDKGII